MMQQTLNNNKFANANATSQPDLLQQALQPFLNDDEEQVLQTYLVDEAQEANAIALIPNNKDKVPNTTTTILEANAINEVTYKSCQDNTVTIPSVITNVPVNVNGITNYIQAQQNSWISQKPVTAAKMNFIPIAIQPSSSILKIKNNESQQWQKQSNSKNLLMLNANPLSLNQMHLHNGSYNPQCKIQNGTMEQQDNSVQQALAITVNRLKVQKPAKMDKYCKRAGSNKSSYCVKKVLVENERNRRDIVTEEQILQKLPRILPSTVKRTQQGAQSVLHINKSVDASESSVKTIPSISNLITIANQIVNAQSQSILTYTMSNQTEVLAPQCVSSDSTIASTTSLATKPISLSTTSNNNNSATIFTDLQKFAPLQVLNVTPTTMTSNKTPAKLSTAPPNLQPSDLEKIRTSIKNLQKSKKTGTRSILRTKQVPLAQTALIVKPKMNNATASKRVSSPNLTSTVQNGINSADTLPNEVTNKLKNANTNQNTIHIIQANSENTQPLSNAQLKQLYQSTLQHSSDSETKNKIVFYRVLSLKDVGIKNTPGNNTQPSSSISANTLQSMLSSGHNHTYIIPEENRGVKRGRPKKNVAQISAFLPQPIISSSTAAENKQEDKDKQVEVTARTRSGRLSRLPSYMINDYKHLPLYKHIAHAKTNMDNSGNNQKEQNSLPLLLDGLDVPKRNISDRFRCPTCSKCYLGQSRMFSHFEKYPDHGSFEQLTTMQEKKEQKEVDIQEPLKRKGKRRGPWAYTTPEAKSQRRQEKLEEAFAVCEQKEIMKIVAKTLDTQSLFELVSLKFDQNAKNFLHQAKRFGDQMRLKVNMTLTALNANEQKSEDTIDLDDERLGIYLGIAPGVYRINDRTSLDTEEEVPNVLIKYDEMNEPPPKICKKYNSESGENNGKERTSDDTSDNKEHISSYGDNNKEQTSNESSELPEFLNENRTNSKAISTCPNILSATLIPAPTNTSKVLISNPEIQSQLSDNPGFRKVDINTLEVSKHENLYDQSNLYDIFVNLSGSVTTSDVQTNLQDNNLQIITVPILDFEQLTSESFDESINT